MKRNTVKSEIPLAKSFGFSGVRANTNAGNPYLNLTDGSTVLWIAGSLLALVPTKRHFEQGLYLYCWKSSNGNSSDATLSHTEYYMGNQYTRSYYRELLKDSIKQVALDFEIAESGVYIDHKNHKRGDCRISNLRIADAAQNNKNRATEATVSAFYTLDDLREKLASGEWTPLKK
jgi:hypothetical protein